MHPGLLWQSLVTLSVCHASPAGCMIVIMRCASVLYAQGAECAKACLGKDFLTLAVRRASPAGCAIVIKRGASALYAQGAECTKACFGKAFRHFRCVVPALLAA